MSPKFSEGFIAKVNEATDIASLVSSFTALTRKGNKLWGICPFHGEKTPSFSVDPDKKLFYCFGCGKGGDAIKFVREIYNYSFTETIEYLAEKAHINIEYESYSEKDENRYRQKKLYLQINNEAGNYFYKSLRANQKSIDYIKRRGLSAETVKKFALGYAPADGRALYRYLKTKGYRDEDMAALGLIRLGQSGGYDYFRDRLMFPILDSTNALVGFGGRVFDDSQPKYLNSPETPVFYKRNTLFNMNNAKKLLGENKSPLIVTEGYMDVISLCDKGIENACASLGTAFSAEHAALISRYTKDVVLCYDGDSAGINAASRASDIFAVSGLDVRVLLLPDNEDPDSYVKKYGKESFLELVSNAAYVVDFKLSILMSRYDVNDIVQKARFLKEACSCIAATGDEIKWDYYTKQLASYTQTDQSIIKQQIKKSVKAESKDTVNKNFVNSNKDVTITYTDDSAQMSRAEIAVLKYILEKKENFLRFITLGGGAVLFRTNSARLVYEKAEELYENKENIDILQELVYNTSVNHIIAKLDFSASTVDGNELRDYLKKLFSNYYEIELDKLSKQIKAAKARNDSDVTVMVKEYTYLKNELLLIKNGGGKFE